MGSRDRLIAVLATLSEDAAARPLPPRNLTEACLRGDLDAVRAFVANGAALEERTIGFASPLAAAAGQGHLEVVKLLVASGSDVDPSGAGLPPLLAGPIANRQLDVIEILLRSGAPIEKYRTHFRLAVEKGEWDVVDALRGGGASPAWLTARERAALDDFVQRESPRSPAYRRRLRARQAARLARSLRDDARGRLSDEHRARCEADAVATVRADPSLARARTGLGTPVLCLAVSAGARQLTLALLEADADPDAGGSGETPLSRAAARSDVILVEALLDRNADPNAAGPGSPHPLVAAARAGSLACADALVRRGARLSARDRELALEQAAGPEEAALRRLLAPANRASRMAPSASLATRSSRHPTERARPPRTPVTPEESMPRKPTVNPFEGKVFAATGQFEDSTQYEVKASAEVRGGTYQQAVTKKTDFLVAGAKGGSKLTKAQQLGVRVLSMTEFRAMCEEVPITDKMTRRYLG